MLHQPTNTVFQAPADTRTLQNQPTSTADSASEDMPAEADEPPDSRKGALFKKAPCSAKMAQSLLSKMIHTSESDSHVDEDDYAFYEPHRATSSASTYSRSSAVSMAELMTDTALTSPHSTSPSPPVFKQNPFQTVTTKPVTTIEVVDPKLPVVEQKPETTFLKKRCITFACGSKAPKEKVEKSVEVKTVAPPPAAEQKRTCRLKFVCPTRDGAAEKSKPHVRLASPPPPIRVSTSTQSRQHRDSDATLRTNSPKMLRKVPSIGSRERRGSTASNASRASAIRFHEFASSDEEVDDWVKESTCYQRRLTIDDHLEKENKLRKLGKEIDEEDEDGEDDDDAVEDDEEDEEDNSEDDDDEEEDMKRSLVSAGLSEELDEGFQTDDEHGFAHSDDDDDANSDYDWWAPGRSLGTDNKSEQVKPKALPRRGSDSSIDSRSSENRGIPISPYLQRKRSKPLKSRTLAPELPDSTDFVCGTLDEDKPLEQAFFNRLQQRRAAKHKVTPQDIDPTFPTSDPEIDDEEDEDSDHVATESDTHIFVHGEMDPEEDRSRRAAPRKRSPAPSPPRRLRSPPPVKRSTVRRSPPPPTRRMRSPAPAAFDHSRLSSSVPRRGSISQMRERFEETIIEEDDNTPRFNRQAVDIVMGLERKRARRREKMYEKHCRKAAKTKEKKEVKPGKGAERMRDLGIGLNEYRGRKHAVPQQDEEVEVHMLSY